MINKLESKMEQVLDLAEEMIKILNAERDLLNEGILAVETEAGQYILQSGAGVVTDLMVHDYQKRVFDLESEKIDLGDVEEEIRQGAKTIHRAIRKL